MARHAAASYIQMGWTLPEGLKLFSVLFLGGQLKEPPLPKSDKAFAKRFMCLFYCCCATHLFKLRKTRNDGSVVCKSACDAVVEALTRCNVFVTFRALKDICAGTHDNEIALREWARLEFDPALAKFWEHNTHLQKDLGWDKIKFPVMTCGDP